MTISQQLTLFIAGAIVGFAFRPTIEILISLIIKIYHNTKNNTDVDPKK